MYALFLPLIKGRKKKHKKKTRIPSAKKLLLSEKLPAE
jgi:hypothetical protein